MQWLKDYYTVIYNACGQNEIILGSLVTYVLFQITFWGLNLPLFFVDLTGWPQWIKKYKVQTGKNEPLDPAMLKQLFRTVAFNSIVINFFFSIGHALTLIWVGCSFHPDDVVSFWWFLVELVVFVLVQEVLFYYSHRLFHHPRLYKSIHKLHHQWTAPISFVSIYATPIEYIVGNSMSVFLGPVLMKSHITSIWLWYIIAFFFTTMHHSGYHIPFMPSPQFHDYHHLTFNWNFGTLGLLDKLHGTDAQFLRSVQSKRHRFHRWLAPMHLVVPEP